jgi:hypothetical protein
MKLGASYLVFYLSLFNKTPIQAFIGIYPGPKHPQWTSQLQAKPQRLVGNVNGVVYVNDQVKSKFDMIPIYLGVSV